MSQLDKTNAGILNKGYFMCAPIVQQLNINFKLHVAIPVIRYDMQDYS